MDDVQRWLQEYREIITNLVEDAPELTEDQEEKLRVLFGGRDG